MDDDINWAIKQKRREQAMKDLANPLIEAAKQQQDMMNSLKDPLMEAAKQQQALSDQAIKMIDKDQIRKIINQNQELLGENDKMDYNRFLEDLARPEAEKIGDRKHIIELLENINRTLNEVLDELRSR